MALLIDEYCSGALVESKSPKRKGVLMSIEGPFGLTEQKNLNGRIYKNTLWEKILNSDDFKVRKESRALYGEADHPTTLYPAITRISHIVTEVILDKETNTLYGKADILDTPSGRIIKTIYDAGGRMGMSSRGAGDVEENDIVKESDYKFGGFDFVVEPSNKNAYPQPVREQLFRTVGKILTESINEVDQDEGFYSSLLKKLSPDGELRLERDFSSGNLLVLHKGQHLLEESESESNKETTKILKSTSETQQHNLPGPIEEEDLAFYKKQLQELFVEYKRLRDEKPAIYSESTDSEVLLSSVRSLEKSVESLKVELEHAYLDIDSLHEENAILRSSLDANKLKLEAANEKDRIIKELEEAVQKKEEQIAQIESGFEKIRKYNNDLKENLFKLYVSYCSEKFSVGEREIYDLITEESNSAVDIAVQKLVAKRPDQKNEFPDFSGNVTLTELKDSKEPKQNQTSFRVSTMIEKISNKERNKERVNG